MLRLVLINITDTDLASVSISKDAKIIVCRDCYEGIIVFENSRGDVLNLKFVDKFLDNHHKVDVMIYEDFVNNVESP